MCCIFPPETQRKEKNVVDLNKSGLILGFITEFIQESKSVCLIMNENAKIYVKRINWCPLDFY